MNIMNKNYYCVIMAGGIGSRFWPKSRNAQPKQFLDILGVGKSFLQQTFDRFASVIPRENIFIITGSAYVSMINEQIPGLAPCQVIAEPDRRNTAPCITYATYKILEKTPEATIIVTPSDHLILNEAEFLRVTQQAMDFASSNNVLITIGIKPTRPETGYGYIQMSLPAKLAEGEPFKVKTFTEKPPLELAKVFVESGEFFWNSGIFAWSLSSIRQALQTLLPEVNTLFQKGAGIYNTPEEAPFIQKVYARCRNVSIDYGIMEKADNVYAFPGDFGWSDLGTWESLYIQREKDVHGNLIDASQVLLHKVSNSTIAMSDKHKMAVVEGLDHYLVVDTDDVLLICPRDNEEHLKQVMTTIDSKYL
jgi:mannose-1-phosphate guanylyltransferase